MLIVIQTCARILDIHMQYKHFFLSIHFSWCDVWKLCASQSRFTKCNHLWDCTIKQFIVCPNDNLYWHCLCLCFWKKKKKMNIKHSVIKCIHVHQISMEAIDYLARLSYRLSTSGSKTIECFSALPYSHALNIWLDRPMGNAFWMFDASFIIHYADLCIGF